MNPILVTLIQTRHQEPGRIVTKFWSSTGELVAVNDPHSIHMTEEAFKSTIQSIQKYSPEDAESIIGIISANLSRP